MSLGKLPSFDYHLDPKEQKSVEKLVPLHQAKIHIALRADINFNDKIYERGACCLSEHLLVICKRRMFGSSFSLVHIIHLVDIRSLETTDDFTFHVSTDLHTVKVYTGEAMRLSRNLLRDYILSMAMVPPSFWFRFTPHNKEHFPPFKPPISPSQAFQFTYNSYCSYFDTSYFHEAVQYYHKNLTTSQGLFDLNQLPLNVIECNLRNPMDFKPFFTTLKYSPYIFGISCSDITHPDLIQSISPLISTTKTLQIISLPNCNIETGMKELSTAIKSFILGFIW